MKLSNVIVTRFIDEILYSNVPSVVKIANYEYGGFALYAEQEFNIGDRMWIDNELKISDDDLPQKIPLVTNQGRFVLDKYIHPTLYIYPTHEMWGVYGFDSFVNHSCDANAHWVVHDDGIYHVFASKRIEIGDEITVNYNTFEWDSCGDAFECFCGSKHCAKNISGFKYLPLDIKLQLLTKHVQPHIKECMEKEENIIVIDDLMCPEQVEITKTNYGFGITSKKEFEKDELIYSVENTKIVNSKNQKIVPNVNGDYIMLDNNTKHLFWKNTDLFTYFDAFMNHSCNPNVYKIYTNNAYNVFASKNVCVGEELKMNLIE